MNTQAELEEMDYLLSKEAFYMWLGKMDRNKFDELLNKCRPSSEVFIEHYLKEHGLHTDSIIKGL